MGSRARAGRADGRDEVGVQAEVTALVGSALDRRRPRVRRFDGGQLLCAGCRDGQAAVGLPDRRRDVLEHHVVFSGWQAAYRGYIGTRVVRLRTALSYLSITQS